MSRKTSSGFVSAPSTLLNDEAKSEPQACRSSLSSATSSTSKLSISASFKSLVENHTKPLTRNYSEFATSYLCEHVPFDRIFCDDSESVEDVECKFSSPVPITKYFIQEKSRREFGPSVRQKFIIPNSQIIWNDIRAYNSRLYQVQKSKKDNKEADQGINVNINVNEIPRQQERLAHLLFKARQWCETSKALAMDHQFPQPHPNIVRKKYSDSHQKAIKLTRKDCNVLGKDPIFQPQLATPFSKRFILHFLRELQREREKRSKEKRGKEKGGDGKRKPKRRDQAHVDLATGERMDIFVSYAVGENPEDESSKNKWNEWANTVKTIFNDVTPLEELQSLEPHWQTVAEKTGDASMKPGKRRFFKRNVYPPMTMEDYIAEKRKLLPPIKPEYLQTDYLSGIWEPELMVETFKVTPMNYDSRLVESEDGEAEETKIDWYVSHEAKKKCWQWLQSIPSNL